MSRRKKIIISLTLSFCITLVIGRLLFLGNTPRTNPSVFSSLILLLKNQPTKTIVQNSEIPNNNVQISITPLVQITSFVQPTKKITAIPTSTSTVKPTPIKPTAQKSIPTLAQISPPTPTPTFFIVPTEAPAIPYPASSNNSYGSIEILSAPTDKPAAEHPDINLSVRGYVPTNGNTSLVNLDGDTDIKAPKLTTLLDNNPYPPIIKLYKVYDWDWSSGNRGGLIKDPDATLFGIQASPGEPLRVMQSGYDIGGGYQVMVLYATRDSITLKYSREDNVVIGYTIHIQDIWVDPNLVSSYEQFNAGGRGSLPALRGGEIFGVARTNEVKIAICDTGAFMDVRSRKDWW